MKILIVTEDSATKLPQINKWTNKIQKGLNIEKDDEFIKILKKHDYKIPTDDIDNEKKYKTILKSYIRPAKFMFSGMFSEVREFANKLASLTPTDLYIISGRYGLINENNLIIPYSRTLKTISDLKNLNENTNFFEKIQSLITEYSLIILLLPSQYVKYLSMNGFFKTVPKKQSIIIVTGAQIFEELAKEPQCILLPRKGVARIGDKNQKRIFEIFKK